MSPKLPFSGHPGIGTARFFSAGRSEHLELQCLQWVHRLFLSHKLQFSGQSRCPEITSFWDAPISGTHLHTCLIATSFRDTSMELNPALRRARMEIWFFSERSPYHADKETLTSMDGDFPKSLRGVFLQSWSGIGFCHDPPAQKRKIAQVWGARSGRPRCGPESVSGLSGRGNVRFNNQPRNATMKIRSLRAEF